MAKTEGTYIRVAYKNVFGYISTNSWPFFMIQRPTIREKCAWVRSNTWRDERPVFFRFFDFSTNVATGNRKNSEFVQPQPVVRSFAVGFSPISVFFPVQWTGPANTSKYANLDSSNLCTTICIYLMTFFCTVVWIFWPHWSCAIIWMVLLANWAFLSTWLLALDQVLS